ncbi:uncharacterized protein LOC119986542 isoform X2 [Tripterygium wilfordii]|uniref:uncharacterized protein LOC119986542 isoform X2 n=1 Tax=Tripterygium wilfordii TaxID=458696 RepID=UPI0018F8018D|nr:uncharacterized protein LOC119986542 isoform X2 [Tripterygium wilfordii]XP_038687064.1 uncharacterized protein LOC119986542 isoform X2 [Tripterygium wilfordii]XP_038687065.1 uncharacterized protein LOC119986542 isoform X2 [Tripterygium wilfordii]XP_038687066.1 uncharacterized protein LOC119986542 isoform X2 [Tripterygium wilfordii]XP_038687067.1 uncharacterized protein LOC119986542 isoform X2 [Tripterygium wilfordii]XP_038687068.1 uncharacterized protein LOC119986542 isoform X2 [Tripterygiu
MGEMNHYINLYPENNFENPHETQLSDLNLRLSLGGIYGGNLKKKPFTRSVPELITHNNGTIELGNFLSLEASGSMPNEEEGQQRRKMKLNGLQHIEAQSKRGNAGEKKSIKANKALPPPSSRFKITWLAIASAENNPAFNRALARIKAGEAYMTHRRRRIKAHRKINTSIGEANKETNLSPDAIDSICDNKKTKETQLSQQEQAERSDLNLGLSLRSICDENFKGKPVTCPSSVTGILTQSKDNGDLGTFLSMAGSWSMPTEGEQEQRRAINSRESQIDFQNRLGKEENGGDKAGKEKASLATNNLPPAPSSSKITTWAAAFVEKNPALHRSLARMKEKEGCMFRKRLRLAYLNMNT